MRRIGIREARLRLSQIISDVRAGGEWVITHHGRPVGRLVPPAEDEPSLGERIRRLEREGLIQRHRGERPLPRPFRLPSGQAQRFLREDRER